MADDKRLLDELGRKPLDYARHRFLWTWLAVGVLAILTGVALVSAGRTAETNLEQTDDIARVADQTATAAQDSTDQVVSYMRGETGLPGVPGSNGEDGTPGLPGGSGDPGSEGPKGDDGVPGEPGPQGVSGSSGPAGQVGEPGSIGLTGTVGPRGPMGDEGPTGERGEPGSNGKEGGAGPAGPQGAQGPPGGQGPPGLAGPPNTTVAVGSSANDTAPSKSVQVTCSAGRASGGGYAVVPSDPGLIVTASSPVGNAGWNATVEQLSLPPGTAWQVLVFAICVT